MAVSLEHVAPGGAAEHREERRGVPLELIARIGEYLPEQAYQRLRMTSRSVSAALPEHPCRRMRAVLHRLGVVGGINDSVLTSRCVHFLQIELASCQRELQSFGTEVRFSFDDFLTPEGQMDEEAISREYRRFEYANLISIVRVANKVGEALLPVAIDVGDPDAVRRWIHNPLHRRFVEKVTDFRGMKLQEPERYLPLLSNVTSMRLVDGRISDQTLFALPRLQHLYLQGGVYARRMSAIIAHPNLRSVVCVDERSREAALSISTEQLKNTALDQLLVIDSPFIPCDCNPPLWQVITYDFERLKSDWRRLDVGALFLPLFLGFIAEGDQELMDSVPEIVRGAEEARAFVLNGRGLPLSVLFRDTAKTITAIAASHRLLIWYNALSPEQHLWLFRHIENMSIAAIKAFIIAYYEESTARAFCVDKSVYWRARCDDIIKYCEGLYSPLSYNTGSVTARFIHELPDEDRKALFRGVGQLLGFPSEPFDVHCLLAHPRSVKVALFREVFLPKYGVRFKELTEGQAQRLFEWIATLAGDEGGAHFGQAHLFDSFYLFHKGFRHMEREIEECSSLFRSLTRALQEELCDVYCNRIYERSFEEYCDECEVFQEQALLVVEHDMLQKLPIFREELNAMREELARCERALQPLSKRALDRFYVHVAEELGYPEGESPIAFARVHIRDSKEVFERCLRRIVGEERVLTNH